MRRSFLFIILIGYALGLILGPRLALPAWSLGGVMALAGLLLWFRRARYIGWAMMAMIFGIGRWQQAVTFQPNSIATLIGQSVSIRAVIQDIPATANEKQQLVLGDLHHETTRLSGRMSVNLPMYPSRSINDRIAVTCKIQAFRPPTSYKRLSHGIRAYCSATTSTVLGRAPTSARTMLGRVKQTVVTTVATHFSEPQSSFLTGLLLGGGGSMPTELTNAFQATGTTHIIALSGFNVTIIVTVISALMIRLFGRRWAWIPSLATVVVFVVMTGASASVVRAAVMAVIGQAALFLGRPVAVGRLLGYTALAMLVQNPFLLEFDLGFQLSFFATIGLVYYGKMLQRYLSGVPEAFSLRENGASTLGAMLVTEPWIIWTFGRFSLIAPFVNIVVLPFIPVAMGLGALIVLTLMIWEPLGSVLLPAVDALLRAILAVITTGAGTAAASLTLGFGVAAAVASGCIFLLIIISFRHEQKNTA